MPRPKSTAASASASAPASAPADGPVDAVRARILRVARARFFRLGFARCTMDDLARELGMSKKTVYLHFRSKEQIIDSLITMKAAEVSHGFDEILAAEGLTFAERAARAVHHGTTKVSELSFTFLHDLQRFAPASYARLEEFRGRFAPRVWEHLLTEGIRTGAVRPDIDPPTTARMVVVALQALMHPDNLERLQLPPHVVLRDFFHLMLAGILTAAGRAEYETNPPLST